MFNLTQSQLAVPNFHLLVPLPQGGYLIANQGLPQQQQPSLLFQPVYASP